MNCSVLVMGTEGLAGVTAIDASVATAVTVKVVEPQMAPAHAVMVVVPAVKPNAAPAFVVALVIVATVGFELLHVTDRSACVAPENMPVAAKFSVLPVCSVGLVGPTEID